jgi:hypothetical protein
MTAGTQFLERRIPREQGTLYARDYEGSGPTFVLMHGFPDNLRIYDDLIPFRPRAAAGSLRSIFWGSEPPTSRGERLTASSSNSAIWKRS